jgi:hypothetical protein
MRASVALTVLLSLAPTVSVAATLADRDAYFMNEAEEIRIARTAGPPSVTASASVYVLRAGGYELAERGEGAFHCFVERSWSAPDPENRITFDPRIRAPHCINAEGAETILQENFMVASLALQGLPGDEINRRVDAALASGELRSPSRTAMTYMMSRHQWLGEGQSAWKPHVMLWMPGLTRAEVGGGNDTFLVGKSGSHRACLVVAVSNFLG